MQKILYHQRKWLVAACVAISPWLALSPWEAEAQSPVYVENVQIPLPAASPVYWTGATVRIPPIDAVQTDTVSTGLTLSTLQEIAAANNPSLSEAAALVQAAQGRWLQAGLPPNPTFGYSGQQIGSHGLQEQQGVVLGQQIITGGKLRLNRQVMAQDIQIACRNYAVQRLRVQTDVAINFFEAFASQQRERISFQLLQNSLESVKNAEALIVVREGTRIDLLQARLAAENAKIIWEQTQNRTAAAWRNLTAVVGLPAETPKLLEDTLETFPRPDEFETLLTQLVSNSPEIAAARAGTEKARWAYQLAMRERVPNLDVQGIVQRDEGINGTDGAMQVTMPFPLWDRKQGRIREAYAQITVAEQAESRLRLNLRQRLASVYESYFNAERQIEHYSQQILPDSEEQYQLTIKARKAGEANYHQLLSAQRTLAQAELAYLEAKRERAIAASQIQGMLLSESLANGVPR